MLDRLNLPASLRHLIEKRVRDKDRRARERRRAAAQLESLNHVTEQDPVPAEAQERRSESDRRVTKRRETD